MKLHTLTKNPLITGTIILTLTGLFSKSIGFFYRIFLSNAIGEEGMGLYQLVFPAIGVCMAVCAMSFQTAISRFTAAELAAGSQNKGHLTLNMGLYQLVFPAIGVCMAVCAMSFQTAISRFTAAELAAGSQNKGHLTLKAGMILSVSFSLGLMFLLYTLASPICAYILLEERCEPLLKIASLSLPFSTIHSCLSGYYYGRKKAAIPALAQVIEQLVRVTTVFLIWKISIEKGRSLTPLEVMAGMTIGETASAIFISISYLLKETEKKMVSSPLFPIMKNLISMAIPLSANRFILSILQSAEAILIPSRLQLFGLTNSQSLSIYGVLTGMAMPFILFPSTLTNSVSVMLLPIVAEAQSADNHNQISRASSLNIRFCLWLGILLFPSTLTNSVSVMLLPIVAEAQSADNHNQISRASSLNIRFCLWLGILCTTVFILFGNDMGSFIFHSETAGRYLTILAWLCPFLYLSSTISSILNGLGKTKSVFFHNVLSMGIRLIFIIFFVPIFGITAYLWGALFSQLFLTILHITCLWKISTFSFSAYKSIFYPLIFALLAGSAAKSLQYILNIYVPQLSIFALLISILFMVILFYFMTSFRLREDLKYFR